jgi:hypothetical protein
VRDLVQKLNALMLGGAVNTSLDYLIAVVESSNLSAVLDYSVVYELEAILSAQVNVVTGD